MNIQTHSVTRPRVSRAAKGEEEEEEEEEREMRAIPSHRLPFVTRRKRTIVSRLLAVSMVEEVAGLVMGMVVLVLVEVVVLVVEVMR